MTSPKGVLSSQVILMARSLADEDEREEDEVMISVAGYFRVSVARDEMKAPELYTREIEQYCAYRDLKLVEVFSDIDYSGYNRSEKRPALNELVRRRREFSAVVIPKLSRFGRSLKHLTQLFDAFDCDGISLTFLDLGMDTNTSQGRLLRNIMGAFAEYESDVRGDYTRANARYAAQQGRPFGGGPPYGYVRRNKTYEPHPRHAQVVRFIFSRYRQGASQFRIARELGEREVATANRHGGRDLTNNLGLRSFLTKKFARAAASASGESKVWFLPMKDQRIIQGGDGGIPSTVGPP